MSRETKQLESQRTANKANKMKGVPVRKDAYATVEKVSGYVFRYLAIKYAFKLLFANNKLCWALVPLKKECPTTSTSIIGGSTSRLTLKSLPDSLLQYIAKKGCYDDFLSFGMCCKRTREVCYGNGRKYKFGMARALFNNIVDEVLLVLRMRSDKESIEELRKLFNNGNCPHKYLRYHHLLEKDHAFFYQFVSRKEIVAEFWLLYAKLQNIIDDVVGNLSAMKKQHAGHDDIFDPLLARLRQIVVIRRKFGFERAILSLVDLLLQLKSKQDYTHDFFARHILKCVNQNYQFLALFRWIYWKFDAKYDMMLYTRHAGSNSKHIYLSKVIFNATPALLDAQNLNHVDVPVNFGAEFVYFALFGSVNCQEIPIKIRAKKFNGRSCTVINNGWAGDTSDTWNGKGIVYQSEPIDESDESDE